MGTATARESSDADEGSQSGLDRFLKVAIIVIASAGATYLAAVLAVAIAVR